MMMVMMMMIMMMMTMMMMTSMRMRMRMISVMMTTMMMMMLTMLTMSMTTVIMMMTIMMATMRMLELTPTRLDLFSKPRVFRVMSVCWIGTTTLLSYLYFINASSLETDVNSFQLVCRTPEEATAGISYYEKILRRNVLLRRLLGEQMEYYIQVSSQL